MITGRGFEGKTCRKGRVTWSLLTRGMDARAAGCGHTSVKKLNNQLIITVQERWGGVWDLAASLDPVHFRVLRAAVITSWSSRRVREQFQKLRKPTAVICGSKCFFSWLVIFETVTKSSQCALTILTSLSCNEMNIM